MDDNKIVNQNPSPVAQADQAQQPAGSINKETGPVGQSDSEFFKPTDTEPRINQELKELGVETKSDKPDLHKQLGVDHAGSNITVSTQPSISIQLPMSEEEIKDQLKTGRDDDSAKGLAKLIRKIIAWGLRIS